MRPPSEDSVVGRKGRPACWRAPSGWDVTKIEPFWPATGGAQGIYERLDELDPNTFETRAAELLFGLGFEKKMMAKATKVTLPRPGPRRNARAPSATLRRTCAILPAPT